MNIFDCFTLRFFSSGFCATRYGFLWTKLAIGQPFSADPTNRQIGPLLIVNTKGLTGIISEIELGKVAI